MLLLRDRAVFQKRIKRFLLMKEELLQSGDMDTALKLASESGKIELTGELMDYREKHFPKKTGTRLSLGDWSGR